MSSCLSGGGRAAYGFDLDIVVKPCASPATSTRSAHSSSPSSTLSESGNSPLALSTKRARAPRKRPNQTYNEAAALLSTVYPNVFSARGLPRACRKGTGHHYHHHHLGSSPSEPHAELLLPPFPALGDAGFLLHRYVPDEPSPRVEPRPASSPEPSSACLSPASAEFRGPSSPAPGLDDDFDAESILDEEVGGGIDSIMGNLSVNTHGCGGGGAGSHTNPYPGNSMGFGFGGVFKYGYRHGGSMRRALRGGDDGEWWRSPTVEVVKIAPKLKPAPAPEKKKKKKVQKVERVEKVLDKAGRVAEKAPEAGTDSASTAEEEEQQRQSEAGKEKPPALGLKLSYEEVAKAWTGRGSPFSDAVDSSESPADTIARLSQIDLFPEGAAGAGGVREASVLRYKEKRRTRLFSKKIRYQVRKVNADRRPRMKASGRFVRRPSLSP